MFGIKDGIYLIIALLVIILPISYWYFTAPPPSVVIASNTAPVSEVIQHGKNRLLVDFFSPTEIADAVDLGLNKPKQYQKMRQAARKAILDKYTIEQGIKQYINLFESMLNSN